MKPTAILYPGIAMFALTISMIGALAFARVRAVRRGDVSLKYFRTYDEGSQPARLHLLGRHVQNHFEIPPLFHVGLLLSLVTGSVSALSVGLAWGFVAARCVHSYIHLGSNDVGRRFYAYFTSIGFLVGLWLTVLVSLLQMGA